MKTPENTLSDTDNGDDIQRRFRYQNACACFISLSMLSDDCTFSDVFCEHHEDILLKLNNGHFAGVQIKTRNLDLGPFDINDEAVKKSFKRFVELYIKFPGKFDYFVFATNIGLLKSESKGPVEYIEWLKKSSLDTIKKSKKEFGQLTRAISKVLNCDIKTVIETLMKVRFKDGMPHDNDISEKIVAKIGAAEQCKNTYFSIVFSIVEKLIKLHDDASSLKSNTDYTFLSDDPENELVKAIIEGKRITKDKLLLVVTEELFIPNHALIRVKNNMSIQDIPKSVKILEKKMDVGDISIDNINLMKDQKYAFETFIVESFYKDKVQSEIDYNHLRQMALSESLSSHDINFDENNSFGMKMLINIKERIRERYKVDKENFCGCQIEHLLGLIAILTEECKIWWSVKFDIETYGDI